MELERSECLTLLAANELGRVVVTSPLTHTPVIRPVNYIFDTPTQSVIFRTAEGSKFTALVQAASACFEIDGFDSYTRSVWSVIIVGVTAEVTRIAEVRRFEALGLEPWASGDKPHWISIRARTVSGRRIIPAAEHPEALDDEYRRKPPPSAPSL